MAACDLRIELEEQDRVYTGGEPIRGHVIVNVQKDVRCKGLIIKSGWSTHGRGNIDRGDAGSFEAFAGEWRAGEEYRYAFDLPTAEWPPTYYGNYLNVSHQVEARAKLPWAFDPKAHAEFPVTATSSPDDLAPTKRQDSWPMGVVGWIIAAVLIALLSFAAIFLIPILLLIGGIFWFFRSYLPKSITGKVACTLEPERLKAGQSIRGSMVFTPKRNSQINGVTYKVICEEVCVSGSGSNRTTHRHELLGDSQVLLDATTLQRGEPQAFEFEYGIPESGAPSMDLSDNDLKWKVEMRVDIPRWPDFVKSFDLIVEPSGETEDLVEATRSHQLPEESWLDQVIEQLLSSENDRERLDLVLEAIRDHEFQIEIETKQSTLRPAEAEHVHGGRWYLGYDRERDLDYKIHFASPRSSPSGPWQGRVKFIGFEADTETILGIAVE